MLFMGQENKTPSLPDEGKVIKKVWIRHADKLVSFHEVDNTELYEAEEREFWAYIVSLTNQGYKMQ